MELTPNEQRFVLWLVCGLLVVFGSVIAYMLKLGVDRLDKIATSVNNIEKDFSVLANDHENLKSDHHELKEEVRNMQTQLQKR